MSRITDSDRECTVGQARAALEEARRRGVGGWSRINPELCREQSLEILSGCVEGRDDNEPLESGRGVGLVARNIRREFGVDGKLPGLKEPKKYRRRKSAPGWPVLIALALAFLIAAPALADEQDLNQWLIDLERVQGELMAELGQRLFCTEETVPPVCPGSGPTITWDEPEKIGPPPPPEPRMSTGVSTLILIDKVSPGHGFAAECYADEALRRECDVSYLEPGAPLPLLDSTRLLARAALREAVG